MAAMLAATAALRCHGDCLLRAALERGALECVLPSSSDAGVGHGVCHFKMGFSQLRHERFLKFLSTLLQLLIPDCQPLLNRQLADLRTVSYPTNALCRSMALAVSKLQAALLVKISSSTAHFPA
tara:strand:- start:1671 stop:2042 length:372 start_codon:yes stop_codon:yes gene_type:complete